MHPKPGCTVKLWRGLSESWIMFILALIASILLNAIVGRQRSRFNTLCRGICDTRELLPGSCASLDTLLDTCDRSFASGASTDMHERTPNGSKACVRKVRRRPTEGVLSLFFFLMFLLPKSPTGVLLEGRYMETPKSPKRCPLPRRHPRSSPTRLSLDAG
jgi:hypothetical protein